MTMKNYEKRKAWLVRCSTKSVKGQGFWPQVRSDGPVGVNGGAAARSRLWADPTADMYSFGDSIHHSAEASLAAEDRLHL